MKNLFSLIFICLALFSCQKNKETKCETSQVTANAAVFANNQTAIHSGQLTITLNGCTSIHAYLNDDFIYFVNNYSTTVILKKGDKWRIQTTCNGVTATIVSYCD